VEIPDRSPKRSSINHDPVIRNELAIIAREKGYFIQELADIILQAWITDYKKQNPTKKEE